MAVRDILIDPHPILREQCAEVTDFGEPCADLLRDLCDTLAASGAIGLSAPQIGAAQRIVAVHVPDDGRGLCVYTNPELIRKRGLAIIEESCLSVPGVEAPVMRSAQVLIRYRDENGDEAETEVDGLHAVCLQHEMDHLEGKLFTDRLSWWRRRRLRRAA
ncbi:MAG: peptide deformylase [Halieaceae bacterium]|jgi:peptide deformylase|nr:peptide deformylase [Halieaceae bacterium]